MAVIIFFIAHWYLSLFTQTFFHHRYSAHQMFTMSRGWEKFFFIISFLFQGPSYLSATTYGILHRLHHAYADTEKDPHSPKYDKNVFAMMWRTKNVYLDIMYGRMKVEPKFRTNVAEWKAFDKIFEQTYVRILWSFAYIAFYYFFADPWGLWFLLPIQLVMGPFHGAVINWLAHKVGYRNFDVGDTSTNIMPVDIFMLGEGYHNNHHKYGGRPNFGVKWHEIDPIYPFILLFNKLGIIRLKKNSTG